MADIELVIKIPEDTVNAIKDNAMLAGTILSDIRWDVTNAIVNGTPLNEYIDKAFDDLNKCKCGSSYIVINGETYCTDIGCAFDGIELFIKYLKGTLSQAESEGKK